jgi:hypothetical protein
MERGQKKRMALFKKKGALGITSWKRSGLHNGDLKTVSGTTDWCLNFCDGNKWIINPKLPNNHYPHLHFQTHSNSNLNPTPNQYYNNPTPVNNGRLMYMAFGMEIMN